VENIYLIPLIVPFVVSFGFVLGAAIFVSNIKIVKEENYRIIFVLVQVSQMIIATGLCVMTVTSVMIVLLKFF
jgi:hypothetical protein